MDGVAYRKVIRGCFSLPKWLKFDCIERLLSCSTYTCHPYGWHSFVCQLCTHSYTIAIVNGESPMFLPPLLIWHATFASQCGNALGSLNFVWEKTYLP
jgi:hypothetical protein